MRLNWFFALIWLAPMMLRAGGDEVVVVYNSRLPASKAVAEHYAKVRQVPAGQIFGFGLTTNEVMTRDDFTDFLQKPLAQKLEDKGLWKFSKVATFAARGKSGPPEFAVTQSKIRYAVLCYGVPLKIEPDSRIEEAAAKLLGDQFRRNEASVDSELAWLPQLRMNVSLTGPLPNKLYGCTNRSELNCTNGILLVSRLDGPTPEIAGHLVDKAVAAEQNGLWGRAYFDARGLATNSNYYLGDAWMRIGAEICRQLGFETEMDTNEATLPASFPLSQIAIYAGWYTGDVNGPFARPQVEFMPGAFAYHLYSFSAATLRSATRNWCGPLLAKGATCTMGCVYEPYLQFSPNIAEFLQKLGSGFTFGEAAWAAQNALSWQTTVIGDPLYQPFKKSLAELHAQLAREKNPLIEWSFDRIVCLDLLHGMRKPQLIQFLANIPATAHSAVLTEKLADLYSDMGMPSSAIETWQNALALNPSPEQRLRIRLALGKKLIAQDLPRQAMKNYQALLSEAPGYPGKNFVEDKIQSLEQKLNTARQP
jgi:uncharacterized protein (TIGR03790 family)